MSYSALTSGEITSGEPVTNPLWEKVKANFIDHESRIQTLETYVAAAQIIKFTVQNGTAITPPATGVMYERLFRALTLTGCRVFVVDAGASGTVDIDVQKSAAGGGAFSSIFSTRPTVAFGAGNYALSSNAVLSTTALVAGDILRLDIQTVQTGNTEFHVYLTY
jgi:hypothetical protein